MPQPLTSQGLDHVAEVAGSHVGDDKVPGLVALVASGDQVHVEAQGRLAVGGPEVRRDSMFRIASTTKPVTGAAVMALIGEGRIRIDDAVDRWLPELAGRRVLRRMDGPVEDTVPASRPVTVRDLLTFTFGFGMILDMFLAAEPWPIVQAASELPLATMGPPSPDQQPDPDEWMAALGSLPLIAQPGERWLYNTSASVLGVLAARVAGMPFPDVLRTRILEPLGMDQTAFFAPEPRRLATAYVPGPDGLAVWDPPDGQWSHPPAFPDGAAGLVSTVDDLLAFARAMLPGGSSVLGPDAVKEMTCDQLTPQQRARDTKGFMEGRSWGFCQSVVTAGPRAGAFGWDGGLGTSWLVDPVRDLIVIVLTQRLWETAELPLVHRDIQDAAYSALAP